jgi:glycosyltransferase involved in cell wall biosynthesis
MPAYNSAGTLRSAVESMLAQTLGDFELIISDNASTDATWSVIQDLIREDSRVVAIRQPANIGANGNYSAVFREARGRYFKWASSNDLCSPSFLQDCVDFLARHPGHVAAMPGAWIFVNDPSDAVPYEGDLAYEEDDAVERMQSACMRMGLNNVLNGVIRTEALRRTFLIEHFVGSDVVLVGQLALIGKIALLPQRDFYRRMSQESATQLMSAEALHAHHYPVRTARALFPTWRRTLGWLRASLHGPLTSAQRVRALVWWMRQINWQRSELGRDLLSAARFMRQHWVR